MDDLQRRARERHGQIDDETLDINREILRMDPMNSAATNRLAIALHKRGELERRLRS